VICRQVSPFLPRDYKDSCLPCSVFFFTVENNCKSQLKVKKECKHRKSKRIKNGDPLESVDQKVPDAGF